MDNCLPRIVIAGLAGDTGKSLVSLGLIGACRNLGLRVAPFKKGPDFIDAAWLGKAAGVPGRNLDTFLMPQTAIFQSLWRAHEQADIAIVEGNRGIFDGVDKKSAHSTARLAKIIGAPVILVIDATKATRTLAAYVLGCRAMDPELNLAGVILNRIGNARQEEVICKAITEEAHVPVIGAIPRLNLQYLPSRHLGLVTSAEHANTQETISALAEHIAKYVNVNQVIELANKAKDLEPVEVSHPVKLFRHPRESGDPHSDVNQHSMDSRIRGNDDSKTSWSPHTRIGVLKDEAFSFYYPENLEALENAGAELVFISPLHDTNLPSIDGLYAGGGFPEVYAAKLSENESLRIAIARAIQQGLPVWAECGGLMYLSKAIINNDEVYPMVGALPITVEHTHKPQGHGYVKAHSDRDNPFWPQGHALLGHEFHYAKICNTSPDVCTVLALERGIGVGNGRDGIHVNNIVATFTHVHALSEPSWAPAFIQAAGKTAVHFHS